MNEVKIIKVPKYDELSVKALYSNIKDEVDVLAHLSDQNEKSKPMDRTYFFNILNTLQPDYLAHIIKQAQERRNNPQCDNNRKDYILISDEWMSQLTQHPFISTFIIEKNGRTLQLLKSSSKIFKARKPQQQQPSVISLKRFKGADRGGSAFKQNNSLRMLQESQQVNLSQTPTQFTDNSISQIRFNI